MCWSYRSKANHMIQLNNFNFGVHPSGVWWSLERFRWLPVIMCLIGWGQVAVECSANICKCVQVYRGWNNVHLYSSITVPSIVCAKCLDKNTLWYRVPPPTSPLRSRLPAWNKLTDKVIYWLEYSAGLYLSPHGTVYQTSIKYFSFCQPEFEANIFSVKRVTSDKFWNTMQYFQTHI
jgi:hypothetical protein